MNDSPYISICIPAYKRLDYLERLFRSISIQTYKNYEVIITDDSPNESVATFIKTINNIENVFYYRNKLTLGTPENWNESIRNAKGAWIKLMHDDDWFANENSLQMFYEATLKTKAQFIFSAYNNIQEKSGSEEPVYLSWIGKFLLKQSPLNLFKRQFVGNPSCTLIRRDIDLFYDKDFKWVVDFEYYIRCLKKDKRFYYTPEALVDVGLNTDQVTKIAFRNIQIEVPENQLMIQKVGFNILRNIFVYDYYWRLYRNLGIKSETDIRKYYHGEIHPLIKKMINFQNKIPSRILRVGALSKLTMLCSYLFSFSIKI